jgi:hypothetical protein
MATHRNLAELMRAAFPGLREAREASLRAMRARIARRQREVLAQFQVTPTAKPEP